jgi:hypothetical protein
VRTFSGVVRMALSPLACVAFSVAVALWFRWSNKGARRECLNRATALVLVGTLATTFACAFFLDSPAPRRLRGGGFLGDGLI